MFCNLKIDIAENSLCVRSLYGCVFQPNSRALGRLVFFCHFMRADRSVGKLIKEKELLHAVRACKSSRNSREEQEKGGHWLGNDDDDCERGEYFGNGEVASSSGPKDGTGENHDRRCNLREVAFKKLDLDVTAPRERERVAIWLTNGMHEDASPPFFTRGCDFSSAQVVDVI
jgi:hypothetical protein